MSEPIQGGSPEPSAVHRCRYCGAEHLLAIRYCTQCKRYQPDPAETKDDDKTVSPCVVCRELIPRDADKCNFCSAFQKGIGRWLPNSSATISALSALAAMVILVLNTCTNRPPAPESRTDLEVADGEAYKLSVRVFNHGTKPSFVGEGWYKLAPTCDWSQQEPAFCTSRATEPPPGVLKLKADPLVTAVIRSGPAIVKFQRQGDLMSKPQPLCDNFKAEIPRLKACLAFEVIEYQETTPRCLVREISGLATDVNYQQFVRRATCGT